jgi:hypothetical protein
MKMKTKEATRQTKTQKKLSRNRWFYIRNTSLEILYLLIIGPIVLIALAMFSIIDAVFVLTNSIRKSVNER